MKNISGTVGLGLIKLILGILGGIGSILIFIWLFYGNETYMLIIGIALVVLAEIGFVYLITKEDEKTIQNFTENAITGIGMAFALPILMVILYIISKDKATLAITLVFSATALIKTFGTLAKLYILKR
ncbi:TPA: hypothetical protein HA238_01075 [Candidatus Micrarchaeota archaeon]|nr:hypothetical protein [Candidatus Micrarchaeota archaeon]